ncbi:MAG: hypothetical protein ACHQHP_02560 [Bacteroidia bacterium]
MKMGKKIFLFFFFCGTVFYSCKKDKQVTSTDLGYNYYPNDVGHYVTYQVDSIWRDDKSNVHDTIRYMLKELIAATFWDNSNRPTLRIERYYKFYHFNTHSYDTAWSAPRVWTANRTQTTLERKEENITYVKLVFPPALNAQWNGNEYNTLGENDYKVMSVDKPDAVGAMHFDSVAVITIAQLNDVNYIEYMYQYEKYARNIGLIHKERDSLFWAGTSNDTIGYTFNQKIISYGK